MPRKPISQLEQWPPEKGVYIEGLKWSGKFWQYRVPRSVDPKRPWVDVTYDDGSYVPGTKEGFYEALKIKNSDEPVLPSDVTVYQILSALIELRRKRRDKKGKPAFAPRTISDMEYHRDVTLRGVADIRVQDLTKEIVREKVIDALQNGELLVRDACKKKGASGAYVNKALRILALGVDHAKDKKVVKVNVVRFLFDPEQNKNRERPSAGRVRPRVYITRDEFALLLQYAAAPCETKFIKKDEQERVSARRLVLAVLIALLCYAGLRNTEARELQWEMIDWTNRRIRLLGVDEEELDDVLVKTEESGEQYTTINTPLFALLHQHWLRQGKPTAGTVCVEPETGKPFDTGQLRAFLRSTVRRLRTAQKKEGLAGKQLFPFIAPHDFRHNFVSAMMENAGGDIGLVSAQARHKNPEVTLTLYAREWRKAQGVNQRAVDIGDAAWFVEERPDDEEDGGDVVALAR